LKHLSPVANQSKKNQTIQGSISISINQIQKLKSARKRDALFDAHGKRQMLVKEKNYSIKVLIVSLNTPRTRRIQFMSTEDKLFSSYLVIQPALKDNDQYPKQILSIIQKEIVIILNNYNNSFRTKRCQYNH